VVIGNFKTVVKDTENWILVFKNNSRRCFLALGPNRKTILGPREEKSWTILMQTVFLEVANACYFSKKFLPCLNGPILSRM
jgi:hypothetical protein